MFLGREELQGLIGLGVAGHDAIGERMNAGIGRLRIGCMAHRDLRDVRSVRIEEEIDIRARQMTRRDFGGLRQLSVRRGGDERRKSGRNREGKKTHVHGRSPWHVRDMDPRIKCIARCRNPAVPVSTYIQSRRMDLNARRESERWRSASIQETGAAGAEPCEVQAARLKSSGAGAVPSPPASRGSSPGHKRLARRPIAPARRCINATFSRRRAASSAVVNTSCRLRFIATNQSRSR